MEAVRLLERKGYRNLGHFSGGIRAWRGANLTFDIGHQRSVRPELRGGEAAPGAHTTG
jgi:hypothetical protein